MLLGSSDSSVFQRAIETFMKGNYIVFIQHNIEKYTMTYIVLQFQGK